MNSCVFTGRFVADPEIKYTTGDKATCVARFRLAVNRRFRRDGEPDADFLNFIAFGKTGEFVEKYFKKGMKADIQARVQTGSYTNKEGNRVYTTDFLVENIEFGESKGQTQKETTPNNGGFMNVPEEVEEELPF